MSGIHVFNVSEEVTEKSLKMYFRNPQHGGGPVSKVFYPLPARSAVVMMQNPTDVEKILKHEHRLEGQQMVVTPLPNRVYTTVTSEVDRNVSHFMSMHKNVVDELQFIGDLTVDFSYEREAYILSGSWYQLEWALYYLDRTVTAYGVKLGTEQKNGDQEQESPRRPRVERERTQDRKPKPHEIKNPNIAARPLNNRDKSPKKSHVGIQSIEQGVHARRPIEKKMNKNKNVVPSRPAPRVDSSPDRRLGATSMRGGSQFSDQNQFQTTSGLRGSRTLKFSPETDFSENKPRPHRYHHPMTTGIDVTQTDFGDVPMSFDFEVGRNLRVRIVKGDITTQTTNAIVNPSSRNLMSHFGVSRAIMSAAGVEVFNACMKHVEEHGDLEVTDVMHTCGGGHLSPSVSAVLHVVGPFWKEEDSEAATHMMVCTYLNCFLYADTKLWLKSLATPLISAGAYGFPLDVCLQAFFDALLLFSRRQAEKHHMKEIVLVCFDMDSVMASISILQSLLDCDFNTSAMAAVERYNLQSMTTNCAVTDFRVAAKIPTKSTDKNKNTTVVKKQEGPDNEDSQSRSGQGEDKMVEQLDKTEQDKSRKQSSKVLDKELNAHAQSEPEERSSEDHVVKTQQTVDDQEENDVDKPASAEKVDIYVKEDSKNEDGEDKMVEYSDRTQQKRSSVDDDDADDDDVDKMDEYSDRNQQRRGSVDDDEDDVERMAIDSDQHQKRSSVDADEDDVIEQKEDKFTRSESNNEEPTNHEARLNLNKAEESDDEFFSSVHVITAAKTEPEEGDVEQQTEEGETAGSKLLADSELEEMNSLRKVEQLSTGDSPPPDWSIIQRQDYEDKKEEEQEEE